MRIQNKRCTRSQRPFAGTGASLYRDGIFRRLRVDTGIYTAGPESRLTTKTAAIDSVQAPTHQFSFDSTGLAGQTVTYQVRPFKDDVENTSNFRPLTITFDGDGNDGTGILGTATYVSQEQRAGGVVRLYFRYDPSRSGTQPVTFQAIRTAGPTSPATASTEFRRGKFLYSIDTPALSDASAYTYKIRAVAGSITADLVTGITVIADATGPAAPTSGTVEIV